MLNVQVSSMTSKAGIITQHAKSKKNKKIFDCLISNISGSNQLVLVNNLFAEEGN